MEIDITEFDKTETDITKKKEIAITESDITDFDITIKRKLI